MISFLISLAQGPGFKEGPGKNKSSILSLRKMIWDSSTAEIKTIYIFGKHQGAFKILGIFHREEGLFALGT